jgi:hypothetical protein
MKTKSIYLNKMPLASINKMVDSKGLDKNKIYVAIPDREQDQKVFNKVSLGTFKAEIKNTRILWRHKNFFRLLNICVENNALERLISKELISQEIIDSLYEKMKRKNEVLRYILKWLFLPLEEEILPDGKIIQRVSSMAFDELDELCFDDMANKCYNYLAGLFDVTIEEFKRW